MFQNNKNLKSIKYYGDNFKWLSITGIEEVVMHGVSTYLAIDYVASQIVEYDNNWIEKRFQSLPLPFTRSIKYVEGNLYLLSSQYFYRTNLNFEVQYKYNYNWFFVFAYDSINSKFYTTTQKSGVILVFDKFCSYLNRLDMGFPVEGIGFYDNKLYVGGE